MKKYLPPSSKIGSYGSLAESLINDNANTVREEREAKAEEAKAGKEKSESTVKDKPAKEGGEASIDSLLGDILKEDGQPEMKPTEKTEMLPSTEPPEQPVPEKTPPSTEPPAPQSPAQEAAPVPAPVAGKPGTDNEEDLLSTERMKIFRHIAKLGGGR